MTAPVFRKHLTKAISSVQCTADRYCQRAYLNSPFASRCFSSSRRQLHEQHEFTAAPEINLDDVHNHDVPLLERIRILPESPSYFSGRARFTDDYLEVERLLLKYKSLPTIRDPQRIVWKPFTQFKASMGNEPINELRYEKLLQMLNRLNRIDPTMMPEEVPGILEAHKRTSQPQIVVPKKYEVDEWGRAVGIGRRKTATAKAYLVEGEGEVLVNGKNLTEVFGRLHDRESALWALKATARIDKYNVFALVQGGGVTGQAEALTLAVAKALLVHEPALKPAIRRGEFISFPNHAWIVLHPCRASQMVPPLS